MFPLNCWYVAAMAHEVKDALFPRTLLNERVLLYRREDGSAAAIENRCSHRRVSLHLGKRVGDLVQCGYHGLMFDGGGQCVSIPNQARIPPKACIKAYALVERDGFLWIWMGDQTLADPALVPDYSPICSSGRFVGRRGDALHISAPYTYNLENVMDLSHVSFVHQKTVGTSEVAETEARTTVTESQVEVRREWADTAAPPVFKNVFGWDRVKRSQTIRFWPGANVQLDITSEPVGNTDPAQLRNLCVVGPCTPETTATHFKFSNMYRDFALDDANITAQLADSFHATVLEDKVLMEDQWRNAVADGPDAAMFDIAVDRAPLATRRMLAKLIAGEQAQTQGRQIDAAQPVQVVRPVAESV